MGFTVVSMSLSLVAVFIPFMFVGGIVGLIFPRIHGHSVGRHPDLAGDLADHDPDDVLTPAERRSQTAGRRGSRMAFERGFESLRREYLRTLEWALDHRLLMLIGFIATIPLIVALVVVIPKGFFPQQDTGQLQGGIRGDANELIPADEGQAAGRRQDHPAGSLP